MSKKEMTFDLNRNYTKESKEYLTKIPSHNRLPYTMRPARVIEGPGFLEAHAARGKNSWATGDLMGLHMTDPVRTFNSYGILQRAHIRHIRTLDGPRERFEKPILTSHIYGWAKPTELRQPSHPMCSSSMTKFLDSLMKDKGGQR